MRGFLLPTSSSRGRVGSGGFVPLLIGRGGNFRVGAGTPRSSLALLTALFRIIGSGAFEIRIVASHFPRRRMYLSSEGSTGSVI
jgi:hypothetical protein